MTDYLDHGEQIDSLKDDTLDPGVVMRVIDADTFDVMLHGSMMVVRLLLVDAPETVHPNEPVEQLGPEARLFAMRLLLGKPVRLEYDGPRLDHYGRVLAYMWVEGRIFNELLLERGLARMAYIYHPPYKYYERFAQIEKTTKLGRKGIWKKCSLIQANRSDPNF